MRRSVVAIAAAALLAACGTDPEVREPDPAPSGSASIEPAPSMPAQAREDTDEGRVAFVTHWIDVFNHAGATGDVEALSALSDDGCKACNNYVELYRDTYAAGGYFRGGDWRVVDLAIEADDPNAVFVRFQAEPAEYKESAEAKPRRGNAEDTDLIFEVSGSPGARQVREIGRTQ